MQSESEIIGIKEIASILPHRYPLLLVDRIISLDLAKNAIVGVKCLTINELFFQGHFPGAPIMPGVLILEALAQVGGILTYKKGYRDKIAILLGISDGKFRHPAYPGDCLHLHAQGMHLSAKGGKMRTWAMVGHRMIAEAEIKFGLKGIEHI